MYAPPHRFYIIAGEASGDLHGSNLIKALREQAPDLECRAWGGDLMAEAGASLVKHYRDLAFMGFVEVVKNLRTIMGNLSFCKRDILAYKPDVLVLVDYPGFNLRIARWAKQQGIRVVYYISPQIWAWHRSRVHAIRRDVDLMLVILPFETAFYRQYGMEAIFVGHPLLDALAPLPDLEAVSEADGPRLIALLPGSRRQEVQRILPPMLAATRFFPQHRFVVAAAGSLPLAYYRSFMEDYPNVTIEQGRTHALLRTCDAALVKSGTSTLETALLGIPQVVCYAGNPISYAIAKRLVQVRYISLVNLILDRPLVEELIQHDLTPERIQKALEDILEPSKAAVLRQGYADLRAILGAGGASARAAAWILRM